MQVIVCGAGRVGSEIAEQLAKEGNSVTVIDISEELVRDLSYKMDVKAVCGFASYPDVLEKAGAADADIIIALTSSDEVNMITCKMADYLFSVPKKVARIRAQNYLDYRTSELYNSPDMPVDIIISPEYEVAKNIIDCLRVRGANEQMSFVGGQVRVIGLQCHADSYIRDIKISKLLKYIGDIEFRIIGIMRGEELIQPDNDESYNVGDELLFIADIKDVNKLLSMFGLIQKESKNIVIVGGGNIGSYLAAYYEENEEDVSVKIIELSQETATQIADKFEKSIVINGSTLDQSILEEVNVADTDTFIAVTNDDKVNILSSLLAKKSGAKQTVTLINDIDVYGKLVTSLGVDIVVNPGEKTVSALLSKIKADAGIISTVYTIAGGKAEIIEVEVKDNQTVVGKYVEDIEASNIKILALVREGEVLFSDRKLTLELGDKLVILCKADTVKRIDEIFSTKFDYF